MIEFSEPDDDPIFAKQFHKLGTMSLSDSSKGNIGDEALAWAFCRLARSKQSLGDALKNILPSSRKIPNILFSYKFDENLLCGSFKNFGCDGYDFSKHITSSRYIFPHIEAGPDGVCPLLECNKNAQTGEIIVQSKV